MIAMTFDPSRHSPLKGCFPQTPRLDPNSKGNLPPAGGHSDYMADPPPNAGMPQAEPEVWVTTQMIVGHLAMWAVRQYPDHKPPQLEAVIELMRNRCKAGLRCTAETEVGDQPMMRCDKRKLLHFLLFTLTPLARNYWKEGIDLDALNRNIINSIFRMEEL
jgi:hypothetical protein